MRGKNRSVFTLNQLQVESERNEQKAAAAAATEPFNDIVTDRSTVCSLREWRYGLRVRLTLCRHHTRSRTHTIARAAHSSAFSWLLLRLLFHCRSFKECRDVHKQRLTSSSSHKSDSALRRTYVPTITTPSTAPLALRTFFPHFVSFFLLVPLHSAYRVLLVAQKSHVLVIRRCEASLVCWKMNGANIKKRKKKTLST